MQIKLKFCEIQRATLEELKSPLYLRSRGFPIPGLGRGSKS